MLAKNPLAEGVPLAEGNRFKATSVLQAKGEPANAREKVQDSQHVIPSPAMPENHPA